MLSGSIAVLLFGSFASVYCGPRRVTQSMLKLDEHSNEGSVTAKKLDQLELSLAENPTTGYRWNLKSAGEPVCKLENTFFDPPSNVVGRGGTRRWLFHVVESGAATIELAYERSFEREKSPAKTFKVTIRASD
jgi:inhibitor of cysteine peptidase